jgi:ATP-dependent exoDNAse (exonuclease V) beta subunit
VDALNLLRRLHAGRNYRPLADTITQLLSATRAHVAFVLRPAGEQALANVLHVAELARQYEMSGGMSFRGFVEELRAEADGGQAAEAPILEEGSDGVRLMTVHKAKGLEFPVVVLADITAKLNTDRADRLIDRDRNACYLRLGRWTPSELAAHEPLEIERDVAEGVRIAYVAATRARDLLVVPTVGDIEYDGGWTSPLNGALYPPTAARRRAEPASGCPAFKTDSVWRRPDGEPATSTTVCPGAHVNERAGAPYACVWWDPNALDLGVEPGIGIRRESLIVKDVPDKVVAEGLRDYARWRDQREAAIADASRPSVSVLTATEWAAIDDTPGKGLTRLGTAEPVSEQRGLFDDEGPRRSRGASEAEAGSASDAAAQVSVVDARGPERPGGSRFGEMVHAVLAAVPLEADRAAIDALTEVHGRILSAPADELIAAAQTVQRVLSHDLLARARSAGSRGACRRETPVTCLHRDGVMVEGIVDLAFEEQGTWTVVDYKTDRELAAVGEDRYRRQVALYASAIAQATGQRARGVLVRV